jgi:hypothetical protein
MDGVFPEAMPKKLFLNWTNVVISWALSQTQSLKRKSLIGWNQMVSPIISRQ